MANLFVMSPLSQAHANIRTAASVNGVPAVPVVRAAQGMTAANPMKVAPSNVVEDRLSSTIEAAPSFQSATSSMQRTYYDAAEIESVLSPVEAPVEAPPARFDLLEYRGGMSRSLFQKIVSYFECPEIGWDAWTQTWWSSQNAMETEVKQDKSMLPVIAMKGGTPCAAATYSDSETNNENAYVLSMLIRNAKAEECMGGGAAIMCHLIENSKNSQGGFSPLRLTTTYNEEGLTDYIQDFGCTITQRSSMKNQWMCADQHPPKCVSFSGDKVLHQDTPFTSFRPQAVNGIDSYWSGIYAQTSQDDISASTAMLIGFLAAGGILFAVFRSRDRRSTRGEEPLMAA